MNTQDFKRKLTAVFSADVAGYSRLMGENEAETVKTLEAYKQVMFSLIKQHRGRVIDSPGDNLLAEFASVVDAVQCGVAVQKELQARNADLPENRRMQFRIGINLGDVIEEQDRIYGDGVNIAARLESCADPGGICVSKTAFDHIESKLPLGYEYLGEKEVKNIAKPVGAYRVLMEPRVTVAGVKEKKPSIAFWRQKEVLAGAAAVIVVITLVAIWNFYWRAPKIEPASKEKMAFPLPDKPSIAVLPFVNLSEDKSQEYLADGITENIISALSQVPNLFVIARNSTFTYKGKPVKVQQVAKELGVRYVLEGSVQRSGDTLRITAQLIDAITGQHVWSERYNRELKNIFALQDDITMKVITALQVKLTVGEGARLQAKGTKSLEAYLKYLQAMADLNTQTREGYAQARRLYEEVIALDPQYAAAYSGLGGFHAMDAVQGFSKSPGESLKQALELIKKAIAIDESDAVSHSRLGWLYVLSGRQYDKAIAECERAIDLAPNSAECHIWMAFVLTFAARSDEAVRYAEQALRLNPYPPSWWIRQLGQSYFFAGRYEEAIAAHKKSLNISPNDLLTHIALTTAYSWAGRHEEALAQAAEVLRINPSVSMEERAKFIPCKNQVDVDRFLDGLRKAGLK
jgi:adenylate cyclase